jgi:feruloyl esterase
MIHRACRAGAAAVLAQLWAGAAAPPHGQRGAAVSIEAREEGRTIPTAPIPNRYDQLGLLFDWLEKGIAPGMSVTVTAGERSLPLCSYPSYPRFRGGDPRLASSYACAQ